MLRSHKHSTGSCPITAQIDTERELPQVHVHPGLLSNFKLKYSQSETCAFCV